MTINDQLAQRNKTNDCGPFETWRNPATGEESQFVTFPVVNGRIVSEVTLAHEEHGQYMEWTFKLNNLPQVVPETVVMERREQGREMSQTAVTSRSWPRFFIAAYIVIALAIVAAILLRFN